MHIGVIFPQAEIPCDVASIHAYSQGVDALGYSHLVAVDHILGADRTFHISFSGAYDIDSVVHEPFVLFGYLAACTSLELVSCVTVLPQRQAPLVAKQAAEVDILTGGRFRLGVGVGWNRVEFEALGQEFSTRGRRMEEQIGLMRALWTSRSVSWDGEFEILTAVGIAPRPIQQPIPIWIGGSSEMALERVGRVADGWFPLAAPGKQLQRARDTINRSAEMSARDPDFIGMEGRVEWKGNASALVDEISTWREIGATHVRIGTTGSGFTSVMEHLDVLSTVSDLLGLVR